jgi:6,7-dimethyl-8-ribityllumazine synthase
MILIVSGMFYPDLASSLREGAAAALTAAAMPFEEVEVAGALEIPQAIRYAIASGKYHGYVALGTVIRGETTHYDIVSQESSRALMELALKYQAPIGNGILTVENDEQAWERAAIGRKNKGGDAANAVLSLLALKQQWRAQAEVYPSSVEF